ncbi:hypothetical protein Val02_24080 [Virgisporangium aliadipatigenens]|uniref:Uncharacterized protein n=1 Tax=Virgisporangium aliadipatigenens TaxID=741659 RepID=A0A8J4DQM9_9ACTN|nr:AAA family ATPase [Virgisporangium aliadipatigenens]GIJ45522.1 hypothetical protein Val02_24080 [Virgisporangium aliadipatigenens]
MIVWVNGAFGAGKSTTAELLLKALPDGHLYDPEYIGYVLMRFVPGQVDDFQDLPLWRELTVHTLGGLAESYGGTWVVPMTLVDAGYRAAILGGLRGRGLAVRQFVLTLPADDLHARIDGDDATTGDARVWRHDHVASAAALDGLAGTEPATWRIDATAAPEQVVAAILEHCGKS